MDKFKFEIDLDWMPEDQRDEYLAGALRAIAYHLSTDQNGTTNWTGNTYYATDGTLVGRARRIKKEQE